MHAHRKRAAHVTVNLNGLGLVHMLIAHEPSRLIAAHWNLREVESAEARGDVGEVTAVAGVAAVVHRVALVLHHKAAPQRFAAVEQRARRPVLRGHQAHLYAVDVGITQHMSLPPVQSAHCGDAFALQPDVHAQGHDEQRRAAFLLIQSQHRRAV